MSMTDLNLFISVAMAAYEVQADTGAASNVDDPMTANGRLCELANGRFKVLQFAKP